MFVSVGRRRPLHDAGNGEDGEDDSEGSHATAAHPGGAVRRQAPGRRLDRGHGAGAEDQPQGLQEHAQGQGRHDGCVLSSPVPSF